MGRHVFGCDICQDVCPWNRRAPVTEDRSFASRVTAPPLERLAVLSEDEFRAMFRGSAVKRTKYSGFLRNFAIAMANSGKSKFVPLLERLAASGDDIVREAAIRGLTDLAKAPRSTA